MIVRLSDYKPSRPALIVGCTAFIFAIGAIVYGLANRTMQEAGAIAFLAAAFGVAFLGRDFRQWRDSAGVSFSGQSIRLKARKIGRWGGGLILASVVFFVLQALFADAHSSYPIIIWAVMFVTGCVMAFVPFLVWWAGIAGLVPRD